MANSKPKKLKNPQLSDYQKRQLDLFKSNNDIQVNQSDLGTLMVCALRYCVGRATYMPSLVMDITKKHWDFLSEKDKQVIARDVREAIERGNLGHDCDVTEWNKFRDWIVNKTLN